MNKLASSYISEHDVSSGYAKSLLRVAKSMAKAGITPANVDASSVSRWILGLPLAQTTKSNYRRMALTLIRWGQQTSRCRKIATPIVRVKPQYQPTVAWSRAEVIRLLDTASELTGAYKSGCPKALFWRTFVLVSYETGLRTADTYRLRCNQVAGSRLYATHHKTGVPAAKILTNECAAFIQKLMKAGDGNTVFLWALSRKHFFLEFKKLAAKAGLFGTIKWLRRSGATHCEQVQPGSATRFLGHISGQALAARHYIDWTQLAEKIPRPPALTGTG